MKSKCKTVFCVIALCAAFFFFTGTSAAALGEDDCRRVAENFLSYVKSGKEIASVKMISGNALEPTSAPIETAFLAHLNGGGYVLTARSRQFTPVKAYSLTRPFEDLPDWYKEYLLHEMEYHARAAADLKTALTAAASETAARWDFLLNYHLMKAPLAYTPGQWLLTTKWNQGSPYNKFLPLLDNGKRAVAGCVNVAMAQLMRYHGYPARGAGVVSHAWNGQLLEAILDRPYTWSTMPDVITGTTPEYQADEIALLIRDLAIANETAFSESLTSSALPHINVMQENFGYSSSIAKTAKSDVGEAAFFQSLKGEIALERPVLLSFIGQHMVVADGYTDNPAGPEIHLNMGWGGTDDDFYFLDREVEAGGYEFTPTLEMYTHVIPCSEASGDCWVNHEEGDLMEGNVATGNFDSAADADRYEVYLKGATSITAFRGYSNVAFFVIVSNALDGAVVAGLSFDGNEDASTARTLPNLPAGLYRLAISLQYGTSAWPLVDGFNSYEVAIATETMTPEEKAAVDQALDRPPQIFNAFEDLLLNGATGEAQTILVDARDRNGDDLTLKVRSTNAPAVTASLAGNLLTVTPRAAGVGQASTIIVRAEAGGRAVEKSFVAMVSDQEVAFGTEFQVAGLFADQDDVQQHRVILDGATTISGYNGYANQAFYITVRDTEGNVVKDLESENTTINETFASSLYLLDASLSRSGGYYEYKEGVNDSYWITVTCPDADVSTERIAALLNIDLSGTKVLGLAEAIEVVRLLVRLPLSEGQSYDRLDVSGDGVIGHSDAVILLQQTAGIR